MRWQLRALEAHWMMLLAGAAEAFSRARHGVSGRGWPRFLADLADDRQAMVLLGSAVECNARHRQTPVPAPAP